MASVIFTSGDEADVVDGDIPSENSFPFKLSENSIFQIWQ